MVTPRDKGHQKLVTLCDDLNDRLDEYRFANRFRSEAAAIRHLMRIAFTTLQQREDTTPERSLA